MATTKKAATSEPTNVEHVPETVDKLTRAIQIRKAQAWLPEVGDRRTSTFVTARRQDDDFGGHIVLIMEDKDNGIYAYHVYSALEMSNLNDIKPTPGSLLTIYNGGKRETNKSRATWAAYRAQVKGLIDQGKDADAEKVDVPERRFYHDNLILAGDGSDISEEEFSWDEG